MDPDRARKAHAVFKAALDTPPAERDALVSAACAGDSALEARVQRLLAASDRRTDFLEVPAITAMSNLQGRVPDSVGNYLVVGILGVGGMATVYEAVQENPNRRVALKVLNLGMTHTDAFLRFRLEADALARLHHPGIAQIYEAGTAPLGQPHPSPFFAMELVPEALTITEFAERRGLSLRERLEMFATVCDAVLHGHQNGIIHRDLKPGNVLVGVDGRAKVIDFGIARTTESSPNARGGSQKTTQADARTLIGTLNYMSPEQCADPEGIDVRADVYSLGVMLYELVTERLPHDLTKCSIPEAVRVISEESPVRAGVLRREASGDLDAIIAKAIDKDRTRRYVGAGELAADIRRNLAMLPVEARPLTSLGQLSRFARRNRALTASIAAAALTMVVGAVVALLLAVAASRSRDEALRRTRELETVTGFQESVLRDIDAQEMGDQIRQELLTSVRAALAPGAAVPDAPTDAVSVSRDAETLLGSINFTSVAVAALRETVLSHYRDLIGRRFTDQPLLRARMLLQLADTMRSIGLYADAEPIVRESLALRTAELGDDHEDTLASRHALASLLSIIGRFDEALPLIHDTRARLIRTLGPEAPRSLRAASTLAGIYRRSGELAKAGELWTEVLAAQRRVLGDDHAETIGTLNNLGIVFAQQGRIAEAETCWREVLDRRRRLFGEDSIEYSASLGNLGVLLQDQGRLDEARTLIEQALAASRRGQGDRHDGTLVNMMQLAGLYFDLEDFAAAEALQRECYEGRLGSLGPTNRDTLRAQSFLASILRERGSIEEADRLATEALARQRQAFGDDHPDTITTLSTAATIAMDAGRTDEGLRLSREAVDRARVCSRCEPETRGRVIWRHGMILLAAGDPVSAEAALHEGHEVLESTVGQAHPYTSQASRSLARFYRAVNERDPSPEHAALAREWATRAGSTAVSPKPTPK